jgi:hypothetical protein
LPIVIWDDYEASVVVLYLIDSGYIAMHVQQVNLIIASVGRSFNFFETVLQHPSLNLATHEVYRGVGRLFERRCPPPYAHEFRFADCHFSDPAELAFLAAA